MEDEGRALPDGWVRSYDPENDHQFYVDTTKNPPRSIWHHPYDDDEYLNSLSEKERTRIRALHRAPTDADIAAESSDEGAGHHHSNKAQSSKPASTNAPSSYGPSSGAGPSTYASPSSTNRPEGSRWGRKLKDKITHSTHEEREAQRQQRAREEAEYYERHRLLRQAMVQASRTGQPVLLGRDPRTGQDVYMEPPQGPRAPPGAYGFNPYAAGPYTNPNARFIRPDYDYYRPYGRGYGGGYGLPIAGGLLGGLLLGGALGGF